MEIFPDFERLNLEARVKFIRIDNRIFAYNVKDSFLVEVSDRDSISQEVVNTTTPPVKTLILHTTYQCNLRCKHCYIDAGEKRNTEMDSSDLSRIVREFGEMGGLGVDLSGGEALLKDGIEEVIKTAREQKLRTVVLSNAVNLDPVQLKRISSYLDGIAVGLDGLHEANNKIRGENSFENTVKGLEIIANSGIELSLTTLITPESIPQLAEFPKFIAGYGGRSWSLVMPRPSGRFSGEEREIEKTYALWDLAKQKGLLIELQKQSKQNGVTIILDHILVPGSKKRVEETSHDFVYQVYNQGRVCWDNTLTIMPNGDVKCCLFFDGQVYDNVKRKSLRDVYNSSRREKALARFKQYPVDRCPFVEKQKLGEFNSII